MANSNTYDVVITHSPQDVAQATEIANTCRANGLTVFLDSEIPTGADFGDLLWEALTESRALLVILSSLEPTSTTLIEIGAAQTWNKPIFGVVTDASLAHLSPVVTAMRLFTPGRMDEIIREIKYSSARLSEEDRAFLAKIYAAGGVSVDELALEPSNLRELVRRFKGETGKEASGEQLLAELLRMRKQGLLKKRGRGRAKPADTTSQGA